ncbi:hypothetical protein MMC17_007838 [Xylographa soralifera]|nr:hypothetical protein [Xylographa soralifera]
MSETAFSSRSSDHSEEGRENQSLRCDGPDVGHAALPLSLDASTPSTLDGSRGLTDVPKSLTYLNCLALVVGLQIGSGIFSAPAIVTSHVSSPVAGVLVWVLAGGLVWTGAASFIELGTTIPMNGGIQEYLRHCYGDIYGFLFAWIWIFVVKPCSMAMVSLIFSEYLYKTISPKTNIATWTLKGTAFGGVCIITGLNCMGTYLGAGTAKFFMGVKLVGLGSITVIGFASTLLRLNYRDTPEDLNRMGPGGNRTSAPDVFNQGTPLLFTDSKDLADALFAALFAYGGWESVELFFDSD